MDATLDEDLIVQIPDDSVDIKTGDGADKASAPAAEKKEPVKRETGWRASSIAKDPDKAESERLSALERERDDNARLAQEATARAQEMEEAARQAAAARADAESRATLREQQAMRAHWARLESDRNQLEQAIAATQIEAQSAERDLIQATEMGDAAKAAAAQRAIAKAEAALGQLESGKHAAEQQLASTRAVFEEHIRRQQTEQDAAPTREAQRQEPPRQQQPQTPEAWIDTAARAAIGDQGAEFLKANKSLVTDRKLNAQFLRFADYYAEKHGQSALKSSDFIDAVAEEFGISRADDGDEPEERPEPRQQRRTASAAPVSRGPAIFSSKNLNAKAVKLPPKLAAFVRSAGLDPTSYALQTVEDIRAGRLPKNYLDPDYDHGV